MLRSPADPNRTAARSPISSAPSPSALGAPHPFWHFAPSRCWRQVQFQCYLRVAASLHVYLERQRALDSLIGVAVVDIIDPFAELGSTRVHICTVSTGRVIVPDFGL